MTREEFIKLYNVAPEDCQMDYDGQVVIYTGIYWHEDAEGNETLLTEEEWEETLDDEEDDEEDIDEDG
jgi:hypothetical protein